MNFTKQDLTYYIVILGCMLYFLNPVNLKHKHVHLTTSLLLSYFIIFPSKLPTLRKYLYNLRGAILIYFVIVFQTDPTVSLLLLINYLMLTYKEDYEKSKELRFEAFQNKYVEEISQGVDNYTYDNNQYVKDSEYKNDNKEDETNGHKHISDEQLDIISSNQVSNKIKEITTYQDGYGPQGTTFTMGYNFGDYGDLA